MKPPDVDRVADSPDSARRRFLARLSGLVGAAIAATLAGAGLATLLSPAFGRRPPGWVRVGPVNPDLISAPRPVVISWRRRDGWFTGSAQSTVFVAKDEADRLCVLSATCTHLGCGVRWDAGRKRFLCPCHGGVYDATGKVLDGPPPRPLDRLETRFEEGVLFVRGGGIGA